MWWHRECGVHPSVPLALVWLCEGAGHAGLQVRRDSMTRACLSPTSPLLESLVKPFAHFLLGCVFSELFARSRDKRFVRCVTCR